MREITIALAQMAPALNDNEENLRRMAATIQRICSEQPTNLIVFPELALSGYECGLNFTRLAERVPGHAVSYLSGKAAEFSVHVAFGMPVKEKVESILFNAAVLIGPDGELIGDYRKLHLRGEEKMAFRPGYRLPVFETEFGNLGVLIGWDLAFPEVARSLTLDGADLIVACAAWEANFIEEWRAYSVARACENAVYIAAANRVGQEPSYAFGGESMLVGPRGQVHTALDEAVEGYAVATIDLDEIRRVREEHQILQARQPGAYRALVRKY
ncbi:MAG: hydrolase protein [Chloroflexota bacterium]|nr:hydrolase protein [Chloroflexota bacterium]